LGRRGAEGPPPKNAVPIEVHGGKSWRLEFAAGSVHGGGKEPFRVNAGGQLTNLGRTQGEALGRRLRAIYGAPSRDRLQVAIEVVSTDIPGAETCMPNR
jgi:hypothetical protein